MIFRGALMIQYHQINGKRDLSFQWVASLDVQDYVMVVLTFLIAMSAIVQACSAIKMTNITTKAENQRLKRLKPRIEFPVDNIILKIDNNTCKYTTMKICLTNASDIPITIDSFYVYESLSKESPPTIKEPHNPNYHVMEKGTKLPAIIKTSEVMIITYDTLLTHKYDTIPNQRGFDSPYVQVWRLCPACKDIFGNEYKFKCWLGLDTKNNQITFHHDLTEGSCSSEDIQQAIRNKQQI